MVGALLQQARKDAALIASKGGFQLEAVLTNPTNTLSLPVTGLATGTWLTLDNLSDGKSVDTSSNHFDIPEQQLIDGLYPYKKTGSELADLKKHKITVTDSMGLVGTFKINECHPNRTLGLIVCILERYNGA
jgi:hypothetical protein